jgi:D-alanyl-D-alanine dipeptidase
MASNGNIPKSQLGKITVAVNGEQAYLRKDAALAFNAMNYESERRFGVTLRVSSARTAYRPLADQRHFWNLYTSGRGNLAARPGTSNHGLGIAVDLATPEMRKIVDQIGEKYGFAKQWSDAPTEWWHIRWKEGTYAAVRIYNDSIAAELRWIKEYDTLKRQNKNKTRRGVLRRYMQAQALVIKGLAKGTKKGWEANSRRARYENLNNRSK